MTDEPNALDVVEIRPGASYVDPEPQEETTTEKQRVAAAKALVQAENAAAPTLEEIELMFAPEDPYAATEGSDSGESEDE